MAGAIEPTVRPIGKSKTIPLVVGAASLIILYFPVLAKLVRQWLTDSNYRHGILIPFVSALILWQRRRILKEARGGGGEIPGLLLVILASIFLVGGTAASELFTMRISLPIFIFGASLFLLGRNFTEKAAFPLLFLFMMVPLPYIIYYKITLPLQLESARLSAGVLNLLEINVIRRGNILLLPNYSLEVVAACSGLRSLMTMFTLSLIFSAFSDISITRKTLLVACAIPAAIAANTFRLVVIAIGAYAVSTEFADGILHEISGLIVFLAGFLLLVLSVGLLKWIK
ncbi:MAG: exosortase/archaeosortase family protein [Candidatus Krumholzibacteria bacterium]|nr:exosortase/archaeosortase family protein [Candidatus Krumholzibacteria bacterium]